jgi:thymidylate kinase
MNRTKLILIEGLPGSGKSTTAHHLSRHLTNTGIPNKWWYEEEKGHPVYIYKDHQSAQNIIKELSEGQYIEVIEKALDQWRDFASYLKKTNETIIIDSCLFGYLTWSLFPFDVSKEMIQMYTSAIEKILKPLHPCLFYFYQDDVHQAMRKICNRRGDTMEQHFVQSATQSIYGKKRDLRGFDGMVRYWKDYRSITDDIFKKLTMSKLAIENSGGKWDSYFHQILDHLELPHTTNAKVSEQVFTELIGTYYGKNASVCSIEKKEDHLILDGISYIWSQSKLLPISPSVFEVESLPLTITFAKDRNQNKLIMHITGPEWYIRTIDEIYEKKLNQQS